MIGDDNFCENTYPPHSLPSNQAGRPIDSLVSKCQLKPVDLSDYPALNNAQQNRLRAIFPDGVCDWSKPGVGEQAVNGTWQSFGPDHRVKARKRKLKLKVVAPPPGRRQAHDAEREAAPVPGDDLAADHVRAAPHGQVAPDRRGRRQGLEVQGDAAASGRGPDQDPRKREVRRGLRRRAFEADQARRLGHRPQWAGARGRQAEAGVPPLRGGARPRAAEVSALRQALVAEPRARRHGQAVLR